MNQYIICVLSAVESHWMQRETHGPLWVEPGDVIGEIREVVQDGPMRGLAGTCNIHQTPRVYEDAAEAVRDLALLLGRAERCGHVRRTYRLTRWDPNRVAKHQLPDQSGLEVPPDTFDRTIYSILPRSEDAPPGTFRIEPTGRIPDPGENDNREDPAS